MKPENDPAFLPRMNAANALDRQSRATTNTDWLHDQRVFDRQLDKLVELGFDRAEEAASAEARAAEMAARAEA